ncbi:MAG: hypothetical protein KGZ30_00570 [Anaplasmataceae bacterium]|nr:hypothetical protein [Anaplasmataceae bacterium]
MKKKIIRFIFDTYLSFIKGSVGSKSYQHDYYFINGKKLDVLENGNLSCAFYVSSVLAVFNLISITHTTVKSTVVNMESSGWKKIKKPRLGCVLVWESKQFADGAHRHIGFYTGSEKAISNNDKKLFPIEHHWTFGVVKGKPKRKVEAMYWHPNLEK